jgi:hypothetical protein
MALSTHVPQALTTEPLDPFEYEVRTLNELIGETRQSLRVKRTLVRVSRTWYTLAIPLLYAVVLLPHSKAIQSFTETLESTTSSFHLGQHVRRIDIVLRHASPSYDVAEQLAKVFAIFRHAPRIEILTLQTDETTTYPGDFHIQHSLIYRLPSLRVLVWPPPLSVDEAPQWLKTLAKTPNMAVCHGLELLIEDKNAELFQSVMQRMSSFSARFKNSADDTYPNSLSLGNLRDSTQTAEFIFVPWWRDKFDPFPAALLSIVGDAITRVVFDTSGFDWHVQMVLDNFATCCPRLKQLVLVFEDWSTMEDYQQITLPSGLIDFGLRSNRCQHKSRVYRSLAGRLQYMVAPNLKRIKFLRRENVKDLRKHIASLRLPVRDLVNRGVQVLDHENLPLMSDHTSAARANP